MTTYARIASGIVAELFSPPPNTTLVECFAPAVAATFVDVTVAAPTPQAGWAATETNGTWTFAPLPAPAAPSLAQQAQTLLATGIAITSTSTPELDGTYLVDSETRADVLSEMVSILVTDAFTNGTQTIAWPDATGVTHPFTVVQFKALAVVLGAFVGALKPIAATNSGTLPAATATIA